MGLEVVDGDEGHVPRSASALAAVTPTSSAPTSPGPTVAATASMRASSMPASTRAWATTGMSSSTWARLAISGTTPPKWACRSTWLDTTDDSTSRAAHHDGRGRLVARRLDAEHDRAVADVDRSRRRSRQALPRRRARARPPRWRARRAAYSGASMSWAHMTMASSTFS